MKHNMTLLNTHHRIFLTLTTAHLCIVASNIPASTENTTYRALTDFTWSDAGRHLRWAETVFNYIHRIKCSEAFFTTEKECKSLVSIPKSDMNVYIAEPSSSGRYRAVLPDEVLSRSSHHDGVVVLDPYPRANFGHLVLVFYVDVRMRQLICERGGGQYIGSGECLTFALRRRCRNVLLRRGRRRNFARRCEINFLPLVYFSGIDISPSHNANIDQLTCRSNIPGFAKCPTFRPWNETSDVICNPIRDNTQRCSTTHATVRTRCRVFEICDQAVILSGGWNRHTTTSRHFANVQKVYFMLRNNGFKRKNIKVFFANGAQGITVPGETPHAVHSSAMKLALRYHIHKLCSSPHCVDSLFFYMNNPAKNDGTSLLWDMNNDGLAEESERYTLMELRDDLAMCAARQIHLVIDQSYAGAIAEIFRNSKDHSNVIVFASGKNHEYAYDDEYTNYWVGFNHTHACSRDVHVSGKKSIKRSSPELAEGSKGRVKSTIFGAPCDVMPPFTQKELRHNYLGCQNLPTALWLRKLMDPRKTSPLDAKFAALIKQMKQMG